MQRLNGFFCATRLGPARRLQPLNLSRTRLFSSRLVSKRGNTLVYSVGIACAATVELAFHQSGSSAIHLEAPPKPDENVRTDPASGIKFPVTIQPASSPTLSLIGLGVRTVSFLKIQVYSVAFYADLSKIQATFDDAIDHIIANSTVAVRIVPTRSTNYSHLRDAFLRSLRARIQATKKIGGLTPAEEDALEEPLAELRSAFPNATLEKGTPLVISSQPITGSGVRTLVLEGIGKVDDSWISREFFKAYFIGEGNSPALVKSVKEALAVTAP